MTRYEKEIYNIISHSCEHPGADQIFEELRKRYPGVALATVYNNLNKLWEAELIRRISVEGMPDRYDRNQRHDHLVCRHCGKLSDLTLEDLTVSLREQVGEGFLSYDLKVFYICPACRADGQGTADVERETVSGPAERIENQGRQDW